MGTTETISLHPNRDKTLKWELTDAIVTDVQGTRKFDGEIQLMVRNGLKITWQKTDGNPISIIVEGAGTVAHLLQSGRIIDSLVGEAIIALSHGTERISQNLHFPLDGMIVVGGFPHNGLLTESPMIRGCKVTLRGHTLFNKELFEAETRELEPGDIFCVSTLDGCTEPAEMIPGSGFIRFGSTSEIEMVADWVAEKARVSRFNGKGYEMTISVFKKLTGDAYVNAFWLIIPVVWGISRRLVVRKD